MARGRNKNNKKPPHPIEVAPPDEQQRMFKEILQEIDVKMRQQYESQTKIVELKEKLGKSSATEMSKKERERISVLYEKHLKNIAESTAVITSHLALMKEWRSNAVDVARDTNELNTIEILKLRDGCLQLWDPEKNPTGVGAGGIAWPDEKRPEKGEAVAAFVESTKTWILADVIGSVSNHRYECIDVDDQDRKVAVFARKQIIPLPQFTVHYNLHPNMAFPKNAIVLALFPGTTCFYEGLVHTPPDRASGHYLVRFIDNTRPGNYSEPLQVSDRYVMAFKKDPVMYIRPSKRAELGLEAPKNDEPGTSEEKKRKKREKKKNRKNKKRLEMEMADDKDIPGPAPKPEPVVEEAVKKKGRGRSKSAKRSKSTDKVKIIRARVPEHKKIRSTRLFGKRRRKSKKGRALSAPAPGRAATEGGEQNPITLSDDEPEDEAEVQPRPVYGDDGRVLRGVEQFGLEEERIETDSDEEPAKKTETPKRGSRDAEKDEDDVDDEEDSEDDESDKDDEKEEPQKDDDKESSSSESDSSEDSSGDEKMEVDEEKKDEEEEEPARVHDPQEGSSSGPRRQTRESVDSDKEYGKIRKISSSSSSSSGSSVESGLSSDHGRNRREVDSDDEKKD